MSLRRSWTSGRCGAAGLAAVVALSLTSASASAADPGAVGATPDPAVFKDPGKFNAAPAGASRPVTETYIFDEAVRQYAEQHDVSKDDARAVLTEQGRVGGLETDLRKRLGEGFGELSFDQRKGHVKVLVTSDDAEASAKRILSEYGLDHAIVGRSRWSAVELDRALTDVANRLAEPLATGRVALRRGGDAGLVLTVDRDAGDATTKLVQDAAARSTVVPVVERGEVPKPQAAACGGTADWFCDAPFLAGQRYQWSAGSCSAAFQAYANGSSNSYNLTAGHCSSIGKANYTCNSAVSSCVWINQDVGAFYTGVGQWDGAVMVHTNGAFPNYPAIDTYNSWPPYGSYPVHGWMSTYMSQYLCKTGYRTHSVQCGTVINTNNGYGQLIFDSACTMGGDSGGPIFDPSNLYAVAITATLWNTPLDGPCNSTTRTGGSWVTNLLATLGLTGINTI